jgi:hypothetical protein
LLPACINHGTQWWWCSFEATKLYFPVVYVCCPEPVLVKLNVFLHYVISLSFKNVDENLRLFN